MTRTYVDYTIWALQLIIFSIVLWNTCIQDKEMAAWRLYSRVLNERLERVEYTLIWRERNK